MQLSFDLTPLTIGARTDSGVTLPLVPKGTPIPCAQSYFIPVPDTHPDTIRLQLVQGERAMASDNRPLGTCVVSGLAQLGPGASVRVTIDIDANGTIIFKADECQSGKQLAVEVLDFNGLSKNDVDELLRWAAQFRGPDEALQSALLPRSRWLLE